jgi:Gly-Xaa carboxypeptidase
LLDALPATTEKAHVDIWLDLQVNGGHSSIPLPHTGIGILSEIVVQLESNPYKPKLIEGSPIHSHYICQARYSPDANPKITKLVKSGDLETLTEELASIERAIRYRLQTSQAVDLIAGGAKINAMPEKIRIGVNHRVAPHDTISTVKNKILEDIKPTVKKYSLAVKAFEEDQVTGLEMFNLAESVDYNGTLTLTVSEPTLAAPISPMHGKVWETFSGSIQHTFAFANGTVVPVGELMTGNTDTRHYLSKCKLASLRGLDAYTCLIDLSKNIYRFAPVRQGAAINIHTVDERIDMFAHMEVVQFYYDLVRNFDASDA